MLGLPDHPIARLVNLSFNLGQALRVPWFQYPRSIAGDWGSFASPDARYQTELAAVRPILSRDSVATILRGAVGSWFSPIPSGPQPHVGEYEGAYRDERWFFVNGICTDLRIARLNATLLTTAFHRPITILYNETEGLWLDLIECAFGKAWEWVTEAAKANVDELMRALRDPAIQRVVLVSHSQGTIVAAVLLKALQEHLQRHGRIKPRSPEAPGEQKPSPERRVAKEVADQVDQVNEELDPSDIGKLELYCFANCATSMEPFVRLDDPARLAPWIESYGNEYDLVAKLGLLAPPHGIGSARIAGDRYRVPGAWGHLFNAHYGLPIIVQQTPLYGFHDNLRESPRLLEYLGGRRPAGYP